MIEALLLTPGFPTGLAVGLIVTVLYDLAIDASRRDALAGLAKLKTDLQSYDAHEQERHRKLEDWKRRCLAAIGDARTKLTTLEDVTRKDAELRKLREEGEAL